MCALASVSQEIDSSPITVETGSCLQGLEILPIYLQEAAVLQLHHAAATKLPHGPGCCRTAHLHRTVSHTSCAEHDLLLQ